MVKENVQYVCTFWNVSIPTIKLESNCSMISVKNRIYKRFKWSWKKNHNINVQPMFFVCLFCIVLLINYYLFVYLFILQIAICNYVWFGQSNKKYYSGCPGQLLCMYVLTTGISQSVCKNACVASMLGGQSKS